MDTPSVPSKRVLKRQQRFREWLAKRNAKFARHAKQEAWETLHSKRRIRPPYIKMTSEERALRGTRLVEANRIRRAMQDVGKSPMAETVQEQNRESEKRPMARPEIMEHIQKMIHLGILGTTDQDTIELLARGFENK